MSSKTVYFEIVNENEEELDYDDLANIFPDYKDEGLEVFELSVADIEVGFSLYLKVVGCMLVSVLMCKIFWIIFFL